MDQAAAQSTAAHAQWRRGIRRDTWSAFLLAIEDAVNAGHSAPSEGSTDFAAARRAVKTSLVVLELEGPPPVVTAAKTLRRTCNDYLELVEGDLLASHAWHAFHVAVDDERTNFADDTDAPAHHAQAALSNLENLMYEIRAPTGPGPWASFDPDTEPEIANERIERAHAAATEALAACPSISSSQARTLVHDAAHGGRGEMLHQRDDYLRFFEEARAAFLSAAQQHLDARE
ncbi:hypothetical protein ACWIG5_26290 [Streptomyces lydicus]